MALFTICFVFKQIEFTGVFRTLSNTLLISSVIVTNADLVTFTEETLNEKFIFLCSDIFDGIICKNAFKQFSKSNVCQSLNVFSQFALNCKRQKLAQGKRKDTKKNLEFLQGKLCEQTFTCSKSSIEIPEKGIKYVQS